MHLCKDLDIWVGSLRTVLLRISKRDWPDTHQLSKRLPRPLMNSGFLFYFGLTFRDRLSIGSPLLVSNLQSSCLHLLSAGILCMQPLSGSELRL